MNIPDTDGKLYAMLHELSSRYMEKYKSYQKMLDWMEVVEEREYIANQHHVKECLDNLNDAYNKLEVFFHVLSDAKQ